MLNYKIGYSPDAICYHDVGHSNPVMTPLKFYYIARNRIYVCQKNYSSSKATSRIPLILILLFIDAVYYEFTKKMRGYIPNLIKAIFWNISNLGTSIQERKKFQKLKKVSDQEIESHMVRKSIELSIIKDL